MGDTKKWVVCEDLTITRAFYFKRSKSKLSNENIEEGIRNILSGKDILDWGVVMDVTSEIKAQLKCTEKNKLRESFITPSNSQSLLKVYDGDSEGYFEEDEFVGRKLCEMEIASGQQYEHDSLEKNGLDVALFISYKKQLSYSEDSMPELSVYKDSEGYISAEVWNENGRPVGFPNSTKDAEVCDITIMFK